VKRTGREKIDTSSNELYGNTVVAKMENIVYAIGIKGGSSTSAVISGYVRDATSGEPLSSATVAVEGGKIVSTDGFGFYSITVPKGRHILKVSSVGMKELIRQINVVGNGKLEMEMKEEVRSLKTIVVAQKQSNVRGMQMGVERLSIKTIKQIRNITNHLYEQINLIAKMGFPARTQTNYITYARWWSRLYDILPYRPHWKTYQKHKTQCIRRDQQQNKT
jgi:hypothetical protein